MAIKQIIMSTSSKPKNRAPAHQNRTAFRHNKGSKLTARIEETAHTQGLCQRCADKVEWRKRYRKYKPLTTPRKCNVCNGRKITAAYRTLCTSCAKQGGRLCEGCGNKKDNTITEDKQEEQVDVEDVGVEAIVEGMSERQRRTVYRQVDKGEDVVDILTKVLDLKDRNQNEETMSQTNEHPRDRAHNNINYEQDV